MLGRETLFFRRFRAIWCVLKPFCLILRKFSFILKGFLMIFYLKMTDFNSNINIFFWKMPPKTRTLCIKSGISVFPPRWRSSCDNVDLLLKFSKSSWDFELVYMYCIPSWKTWRYGSKDWKKHSIESLKFPLETEKYRKNHKPVTSVPFKILNHRVVRFWTLCGSCFQVAFLGPNPDHFSPENLDFDSF